MKIILCAFVLVCTPLLFSSCGDENPEFGSIGLEFDNVVGDTDLELNTSTEVYTNAAGETYKVTALRYYISNIKLKRSNGSIYEDEVSADGSKGYYLIDEADGESQRIELKKVPTGDYTEITFTIGVDANQVTEGAQTGALDPAKGMFWSWNSGYIFVMLEGTSSSSEADEQAIVYHVGGYKDPANNVKTKTVSIGDHAAEVRNDGTPQIHMIVDVNKFFDSPNEISFAETPVQHMPADNIVVAENYIHTFIVDHVHN